MWSDIGGFMLYEQQGACVIENAVEAHNGQTQWSSEQTQDNVRIRERFGLEQ